MFTWIAAIAVCKGVLATDCSVYVYGRSFDELDGCSIELQAGLSIARETGALATGICKKVALEGVPA